MHNIGTKKEDYSSTTFSSPFITTLLAMDDSHLKPAAGNANGSSGCMEENPIDPRNIVRVDSLVLENISHPLQLAPFLLVVKEDNTVILTPCRQSSWNHEKPRVCGVFGMCPSSIDVPRTIGLFTVRNSRGTTGKIIYIIDGNDREDDKDYLECRDAVVEAFKTKIMKFPSSTCHSTRAVGFSSMHKKDGINSSLHVRQCFRELAGMICSVAGVVSAERLLGMVNDGFSSRANAFHSDALFDGVRLQIAKRCWLKDLEDAICILSSDDAQYAGGYGTMVTVPLTDKEEEMEVRNACRLVSPLCASPYCYKVGTRKCPTCMELGMGTTRFCSEACFKRNWTNHNLLHKQAKVCHFFIPFISFYTTS